MAVVKELDRVLSGKVISGIGGSFHRNLELSFFAFKKINMP